MSKKLKYIPITILLLIILIILIGPIFVKFDPNYTDLASIAKKPSEIHYFGTDDLGRDVFARVIYGGRISLFVGLVATSIQILISSILGVASAYYGGKVDAIILRLIDSFLSFPFYILAMSFAAFMGPSIKNLIFIIIFFSWASSAKIIRSRVLQIKNKDFIKYYQISGFSDISIIIKHIVPNILETILESFTISSATAILMEATLSFLGVGVEYPNPSWGNILSTTMSLTTIETKWWMWTFAAILVVLTVLSIHLTANVIKRHNNDQDK